MTVVTTSTIGRGGWWMACGEDRRALTLSGRGALTAVQTPEREIFKDQQEITALVIWARQLVSPQPKLGPVPSRESPRR